MTPRSGWILGDADLFGYRDVLGFGDGEVTVRHIGKSAADEIIRAGHYSGTVSWSSCIHLGVFIGAVPGGAIQFGPGMNPASGANVVEGTQPDQWLELNRMWLPDDKPANTTTRAVAFALKLVRRSRPRVGWIQAFADSRCGKLGAVYQACSFIYCGSHDTTFYELDGQWYHKSMLGRATTDKRGWGSGPRIAYLNQNKHRATAHTFAQYRYIKPLRPWVRRKLLLPTLPYPKPDTPLVNLEAS